LQCVAVCCSVLQCVAVCCSVLQCVAVCFSHVSLCCSVLQCVSHKSAAVCCCSAAMPCSVLQCVAVCCSVMQCVSHKSAEFATNMDYIAQHPPSSPATPSACFRTPSSPATARYECSTSAVKIVQNQVATKWNRSNGLHPTDYIECTTS